MEHFQGLPGSKKYEAHNLECKKLRIALYS